jgi:dienelactone hydrolase
MLEQKRMKPEGSGVPVDIWSYKDKRLQSVQLEEEKGLDHPVQYEAVLDLKQGRMLRLEYENEKMLSKVYFEKPMHWILIERNGGGDVNREWDWNPSALKSVWLMSLEDGTRALIDSGLPGIITNSYVLSYGEKYVYYYDYRLSNYWSYDITSRKRENLTGSLPATIWTGGTMSDAPSSKIWPLGEAGYIRDEEAILVCAQHDIYELDASSRYKAVNLTGAFRGMRDWQIRIEGGWRPVIDRKSEVICNIVNMTDKRRGLCRVVFDSLRYLRDVALYPQAVAESPVRAQDTALYFVMLMTAESSPNLYMTKDFNYYQPVTDVHPERAYNWMTSELVTWIMPDGRRNQGKLYKPEDFDPHKKYPLLVYCYEQLSDDVNKYFKPELSNGTLNMPLYVSHDYLVFEPDIHYKIGWPGRSALEAVESGVQYLCQRPYVSRDRIGLQGHSWGGYETNYIITHSHLFAAAMSACGVSDFISSYGSITGDGTSHEVQYEQYQGRIGKTLWESPQLYIENSPIFRADQVTPPLLMVADKQDEAVPFQQGIEFFTALRRLGKRVWMLQYDGMGHTIFDKASEDLTMRMFQFFNYYLKDEPAPAWMTEGVPARLKGIESGLENDTSGEKP